MKRHPSAITAYHEAGHAVIAMANGFPVTEIVNCTDDQGHGYVNFNHPKTFSSMDRVRIVIVFAAGAAADYLLWCREREKLGSTECSNDLCEGHIGDQRNAEEHLIQLGDTGRFLDYVGVAIALLKKPEIWQFVELIGDLMLKTPRLDGQEVFNALLNQFPSYTTMRSHF